MGKPDEDRNQGQQFQVGKRKPGQSQDWMDDLKGQSKGLAGDRHNGKGHEGWDQSQPRRNQINQAIHVARNDLFLEEHLKHIGDDLERTKFTDAIGAVAQRKAGQQLTLDHG